MARVSLTSNARSVENGTQITLGLRQLGGVGKLSCREQTRWSRTRLGLRMKVLWNLGLLNVEVVTAVDSHHDETWRVVRMETLLGKTFASIDSSAVRGWNANWKETAV